MEELLLMESAEAANISPNRKKVLVEVAADTFSLLLKEGECQLRAAKRQKKAEIDATKANSIYLVVVVHSHDVKLVLNKNLGDSLMLSEC
jgi:rRNA processing protein Krr1/Pno1